MKTNPMNPAPWRGWMNRNLCVFERDVDCGIGYIGVAFVPSSDRGEEKIILSCRDVPVSPVLRHGGLNYSIKISSHSGIPHVVFHTYY